MFGEYVYSARLKNMVQEMMLKASLYNKIISIQTKQVIKSEILIIMQQSTLDVFLKERPLKYKCKEYAISSGSVLFLTWTIRYNK